MKKLTMILPDDAKIDLNALLAIATHVTIVPYVPEKTAVAAVPVAKKNYLPKMSVMKALMDHYSPQASFDFVTAQGWVMKLGYAENSASGALTRLARDGYVHNKGRGRYVFAKPFSNGQLNIDHA